MSGVSRFWWRWLAATLVGVRRHLGADGGASTPSPARGALLLLVALVTAVLALVNVNVIADGPDWEVDTHRSRSARRARTPGWGCTPASSRGHLDAREPDPALRDRLADLAAAAAPAARRRAARPGAAATCSGAEVTELLTGPVAPADARRDRDLPSDASRSCDRCPTDPRVAEAARLAGQVLDEVEKAVVGKREALTLVLAAVLAKGHVLLEDFPGLGKTLAARSLATALGLDFARAQFTPDLLPADLTGSFLYDQRQGTFEFRRGPLFTGLLLADEINRTPPKTQSALLEAMQERQVTVEGETFPLPAPFHVLATANPIEYEGTYPLPEAQLDRFLLRVSFGYPQRDEEYDVLARRLARQQEEVDLAQVTDAAGVLEMQAAIETVTVDESVGRYCVDLAVATRDHADVLTGSSPRGSLGPGARRPGAGRSSAAATTSSPRTSRRWPARCSRTGSPSSPSSG